MRYEGNDGSRETRQAERRIPRALDWSAPVVLLVGRQGFSSNESFIAAMGILPTVTTMGDTTGGGSGNPAAGRRLDLSAASVDRVRPDGQVIAWNGIAPRVHVPFDTAGRPLSQDPIIEAALACLGRSG